MRCVSHKTLSAHLDELKAKSATWAAPLGYVSDTVATEIRAAAADDRGKEALRIYDRAVKNTGLEGLAYNGKRWIYSNTGETYHATLILCPGGSIILGNWGSIAERYPDMDTFTPR